MLPLAPVLFSTTTCWPRLRVRYSPMIRADTSVEPPAGNGTMNRIVLVGQSCAKPGAGIRATRANAAAAVRRLTIGELPLVFHYPTGASPARPTRLPTGPGMPYSTYLPEHMGSIQLTPSGPFIAGSLAELTLVYTAGTFGIDDTGMVKVSWRTTSDMAKPQFDKPAAPNFTTVEASNGAKLEVWFDRLNIRPYANTLLIRVGRGYLREGDTLTIRLGDQRHGSPGLRLQTNVENNVELRTSVDAFATYEFCELPRQPAF